MGILEGLLTVTCALWTEPNLEFSFQIGQVVGVIRLLKKKKKKKKKERWKDIRVGRKKEAYGRGK